MEFEVRQTLQKEDAFALTHVSMDRKVKHKVLNTAVTGLGKFGFLCRGVVRVCVGGVMLWNAVKDLPVFQVVHIVFLLVGLLFAGHGLWYLWMALPRNAQKQIARFQPKVQTFQFDDNAFILREDAKTEYYSYDFYDIIEDDAYYFLFPNKGAEVVIKKACFTYGDPAGFADFIQQKTGLTVQCLK